MSQFHTIRYELLEFSEHLLPFGFYDHKSEGEVNISGIGLKRHTFNIKHYLHKSYLRKRFILAYNRITKLLKKSYFEKFIEELSSGELSAQAKHLNITRRLTK